MDIFFCDLCGARVSDADLRAGHGTRRRWDVICRACLEQGKGQAWLSARAGVQPGVAAAVAAAAPAGAPPSSAAAVLDAPRDRARTLEEDEEPSLVAAQQIDQIEADVIEDHSVTTAASREELAAKAGTVDPQLSSAAGAFAQLGSDRIEGGKSVARGDLDEDDLIGDGLPGGLTPTPAPAISPFAFDTPGAPGGKDETARVEDTPAKSPSGIRTKQGSGARARSPSSSRIASGRSGKSTSGRVAKSGRRGGQDSSRMILIGTGVSAVILIAIMIGIAVSAHKPQAKIIKTDLGAELTAHVEATRTVVIDALRSKDAGKCQAALSRLNQMQSEVDGFEKSALKQGRTEEEVERILEHAHWPDVYGQSKPLRDAIQASH